MRGVDDVRPLPSCGGGVSGELSTKIIALAIHLADRLGEAAGKGQIVILREIHRPAVANGEIIRPQEAGIPVRAFDPTRRFGAKRIPGPAARPARAVRSGCSFPCAEIPVDPDSQTSTAWE